jgi:hypothetical protein
MSDENIATNDNSFYTNLKNKLNYQLNKLAYDPEANKYVETKVKQNDVKKDKEDVKNDEKKKGDSNTTDNKSDDPNKFSSKRLIKKVGNQFTETVKKYFLPFVALMLAMIVTNDMIVYSAPIRIIFFIYTLLMCIYLPFYAILLSGFYLLKGGYSYYSNHMTDKPKKDYMPTIFALFPVTTYQPSSAFGKFFLYPFTYPKNEINAQQLPKIMTNYFEDLKNSFPGLDKVKNLPIFADGIKELKHQLDHLHDIKNPTRNNAGNTVKVPNTSNNNPKNVVAEPVVPTAPPVPSVATAQTEAPKTG